MNIEEIRSLQLSEAVRHIEASEEGSQDTDLIEVFLFPSDEEQIRMLHIDQATTPADGKLPVFHFKPNTTDGYTLPQAITVMQPAEKELPIALPDGWGGWKNAKLIWSASDRGIKIRELTEYASPPPPKTFWDEKLIHAFSSLGTENAFEFPELVGAKIVDFGFHPSATEGGLGIDYITPDGLERRLVLGFNDLGMWTIWHGDVGPDKPSVPKESAEAST
jgi:hypothetical protein